LTGSFRSPAGWVVDDFDPPTSPNKLFKEAVLLATSEACIFPVTFAGGAARHPIIAKRRIAPHIFFIAVFRI
jgi:hypothetical protein